MKVTTSNDRFQPMQITLETRDEVAIMWHLLHLPHVTNQDTVYTKNKMAYWKRTLLSFVETVNDPVRDAMSEAFDERLTICIDPKTGLPMSPEVEWQ